jgi:6-phosphofructokinase 1
MARVGVLTGGGDCPGLNAVIRGVVRKASQNKITVVGIKDGWKGLVQNISSEIAPDSVADILQKGGTILGTSRTNPYKKPEDVAKVIENYKKMKLDALIAIGGEDTLGVANKLNNEGKGVNVVAVPKTIDNDLSATDFTFGFNTAVQIATDAIDRLHTTAESHHRVMVVEIMGRHAGWITLYAGIAGGANIILIPEIKMDIDEICASLKRRQASGKLYSIVAVSEGASFKEGQFATQEKELDSFGHVRLGGIGEKLAGEIEKRTNIETRYTVLGHIQRGGTPCAFDRVLSTRFGVKAMELVLEKKFGFMVSLRGADVVAVPIQEGVGILKTVDMKLFEAAKTFFD